MAENDAVKSKILSFEVVNLENLDTKKPIIYMWTIHDKNDSLIGVYVGKSKDGAERPLKRYKANVKKMVEGKPYKKKYPDRFRQVHHALKNAMQNEHLIKLHFIHSVAIDENINDEEQRCIKEHDAKGDQLWQLNR